MSTFDANEFVWRSVTDNVSNLHDLVQLLRNEPLYLQSSKYTPVSDIRFVLIVATAYLFSISVLSLFSPFRFAKSPLFTFLAVSHNALLSIASLIMLFGVSRALVREVFLSQSIARTFCNPHGLQMNSELSLWLYAFYISKFWELIDTVLLVMRGRPLTVLHVWHHTSVMFEIFSWLEFSMALGVYGMIFNALVHVLMYAYFAAALLKIRVPWKKALTSLQIIQFCTSFASLVPYAYFRSVTPGGCTGGPGLVVSAVCNGSFLIFFIDFFKKTYSSRGAEKEE